MLPSGGRGAPNELGLRAVGKAACRPVSPKEATVAECCVSSLPGFPALQVGAHVCVFFPSALSQLCVLFCFVFSLSRYNYRSLTDHHQSQYTGTLFKIVPHPPSKAQTRQALLFCKAFFRPHLILFSTFAINTFHCNCLN